MLYSNYFKLKIKGKIKKNVKQCSCEPNTSLISNYIFCPSCGNKLDEKEIEIDPNHVIEELIKEKENSDCRYLLKLDGSSKSEGSGYNIEDEIQKFSKKYEDLTFILFCQWDGRTVDYGQPGTDIFFIKNKKAVCEIRYINPFNNEIFKI